MLVRFLGWTAAGVAVGLALALVAPFAFGARPLTVLSGSMEPNLHVGDVVVVKRVEPRDVRPGQVVTFHDPERGGDLVTHRVRAMHARGGKIDFVTRGDANNASEHWRIAADGELGRAVYRIPAVGRLFVLARSHGAALILLIASLAALAVLELVAIWRPKETGGATA
ncbi:MAG TPA: signal peptidase I [Thermoleophilaceae bacterium]|jgi:signal peptidase